MRCEACGPMVSRTFNAGDVVRFRGTCEEVNPAVAQVGQVCISVVSSADIVLEDTLTVVPLQIVTFLRLSGFPASYPPPDGMNGMDGEGDDKAVHLVLVRWFTAPRDCFERDSLHRPICQGPLRANHCKWVWEKLSNDRECISHHDSWHTKAIGKLDVVCRSSNTQALRNQLMRARYDFVGLDQARTFVNMNPYRTWNIRSRSWEEPTSTFLETVAVPGVTIDKTNNS